MTILRAGIYNGRGWEFPLEDRFRYATIEEKKLRTNHWWWCFTGLVLFRDKKEPVMLHPRHWPKSCWKCHG